MSLVRNTTADNVFSTSKITGGEFPLLCILALLQFSHIVDFLIMFPLGPQLMRTLNISPQQFSILLSSYSFGSALFGIVGSFLIDKFDRKHVLLGLLTLFTIGLMICSIANDYYLLLLGRIFTGTFGGNLGAIILVVIADVIPRHRYGVAMGFVLSAHSVASIIGVPLGLFVSSQVSWQALYNVLAIFSLIILLVTLMFFPSVRAHLREKEKFSGLFILYRQYSHLWKSLLFMFSFILGGFSLSCFLSPFLVSNLSFSDKELGYVYLLGGLSAFLTSHITGKWIDKFGERKVFKSAALSSVFVILLISFVPAIPKWIIFFITTLFFTVLNCRYISAMAIINASVDAHKRGRFMELTSAIQQISCGLTAAVSGFIISVEANGELNNFNIIGIIASLSTILAIFLSQKISR